MKRAGEGGDHATDLRREALAPLLGDRPLRTYPMMMSTEAEALAWARQGGPDRAVVVAGHQIAARGRSGLSFAEHFTDPSVGLGCSVVLRPDLPEGREGWLYPVGALAVRDVLGIDGLLLGWPDLVMEPGGRLVGAVGVQTEARLGRLEWAVVTLLLPGVPPPRSGLLAALLAAVDQRLGQPADEVLEQTRRSSATIGTRVLAKILPMGPSSPSFVGTATDLRDDGGLVVDTDEGRRVVVLPQTLGHLTDPADEPTGPPGLG